MTDHTVTALRGKCKEVSEAACANDPTLALVRGWYDDPIWGSQEHWWCERHDGTIVDLTARQFPVPGITALYRRFEGVYPCAECGVDVPEANLVEGHCCSGRCFGRMVGVPCD